MRRSVVLRPLRRDEADAAAALHLLAGRLIPGYDLTLHTPEERRAFYRDTVFEAGPLWGAFEDHTLLGFIALEPGWIEHLYVDPKRHGEGIGRALIELAKHEQRDLQLWTFASNLHARRIYENAGFTLEGINDGAGNDEGQPAVRYRWRGD